MNRYSCLLAILALVISVQGCAVKQYAISSIGNVLAEGGGVYASDDDLELIEQAVPFSLKTLEGLLAEVPEHRGLLVATASGFTKYAYAFVDLESFELEYTDPQRSLVLKKRAKKLYLRARDYALRAVQLKQPGFVEGLRNSPDSTLSVFKAEQVPELYWLAASWAAAIASDKNDMDNLSDLNLIEHIITRCLELDETFDQGALHEFMIAYQGGRSVFQGGSPDRAREHFQKAKQFSVDTRISPLVTLAEVVSVGDQNRDEFENLLNKALAFDVDVHPSMRLANIVAQKRATLLLSRVDYLFLED